MAESSPTTTPSTQATQENNLKAIADAIREMDGSTGSITANDFPDRIRAIQTGPDTQDATAVAGDIFSGKTAYVKGQKITGTMPSVEQAVPSISVSASGLITASAVQSAGYVGAGTKSKTSQLTTQAAATITPGTSAKTAVAAGRYTTGSVVVAGSSNLVAGNIRSGVNIFGITGTYSGNTPQTYAVTISTSGSEVHVRYTDVNGQASSVSIGSTYGTYSATIYPLAGSYGTIRTSNKSIQNFNSAPFFSNDYLPAQYYIVYMGVFSGAGSMTVN